MGCGCKKKKAGVSKPKSAPKFVPAGPTKPKPKPKTK